VVALQRENSSTALRAPNAGIPQVSLSSWGYATGTSGHGVAEHGRKLFTLHLADLSAEQQTIRQSRPPQSHETALLFVAEYWVGKCRGYV
jgi:hypothetical protein